MKIERIEAIPYSIPPYARALKFASGEVTAAEHVLVRIHTDTGICGVADTPPPRPYTYGETQDSIVSVITKVFAPLVIGLDPMDRSKVQQILHRTVNNPTAKGAVDIALWDIIGIAVETPGAQTPRWIRRRHEGLPHARLQACRRALGRSSALP